MATGLFLRQHYATPLTSRGVSVPSSAWIMNRWWTKGGAVAFRGQPPINLIERLCPPSAIGPGKPTAGAVNQCLSQHGYTLFTRYQPATRFWPFQLIEGSWLLVLSLTLIAISVWLVRRRAA